MWAPLPSVSLAPSLNLGHTAYPAPDCSPACPCLSLPVCKFLVGGDYKKKMDGLISIEFPMRTKEGIPGKPSKVQEAGGS